MTPLGITGPSEQIIQLSSVWLLRWNEVQLLLCWWNDHIIIAYEKQRISDIYTILIVKYVVVRLRRCISAVFCDFCGT